MDRDDREHATAHQDLRPAHRGRRGGPQRPPRRGVRLPRPERRREDDHAADAARPGPADLRPGDRARAAAGRPGGGGPDRLAGRGAGLLPVPVRPGEPAGAGPLPRPRRPRGRPGAGAGRPDRARRRPVQGVLARHEAAARRGRGAARRARTCWSSTSRPTASTRPAWPTCARCWSTWPPAGRPCCCPATCWPRCRRSATGSAIIAGGRLLVESTVAELRGATGILLVARAARPGAGGRDAASPATTRSRSTAAVAAGVRLAAAQAPELARALVGAGVDITELHPGRALARGRLLRPDPYRPLRRCRHDRARRRRPRPRRPPGPDPCRCSTAPGPSCAGCCAGRRPGCWPASGSRST